MRSYRNEQRKELIEDLLYNIAEEILIEKDIDTRDKIVRQYYKLQEGYILEFGNNRD